MCDATQRVQLVIVADFSTCNQSLQASTTDHGCYNKSTCANRAVMKILPAPSATMPIAQPSISKSRPPTKKRDFGPLTLKEPNSDSKPY